MKCKNCKSSNVSPTWYNILVDGKIEPIGGKATSDKKDIAETMKRTGYMMGYYNNKLVQHKKFNHCFNCGHENNIKIETINKRK